MTRRVLCAGIGNVFFGDDGFGCAVADRLARLPVPEGVHVEDYGIRGVHLAYDLLGGYGTLVIVDAVPLAGEAPGTLVVLEAELPATPLAGERTATALAIDAHTMSPSVVLRSLVHLGGSLDRVLVVGCQPDTIEEGIGLSAPVAAAVERAIPLVSQLLTDLVEVANC